MTVILFVDMLGARRRWQDGGVTASRRAFTQFKKIVLHGVRNTASGSVLDGGIETDSAMLVCSSVLSALSLAKHFYITAFTTKNHPDFPRLWFRGCIVPFAEGTFLRKESRLNRPIGNLKVYTYSTDALNAISVEKSGFKGMRLLVRSDIVTPEDLTAIRIPFDNHSLIPVTRLRYGGYPKLSDDKYLDFLWMAYKEDSAWYNLNLHMTSRLRFSSHDSEEFAQAAATQVVFHECAALRRSVVGRAKRAADKRVEIGIVPENCRD